MRGTSIPTCSDRRGVLLIASRISKLATFCVSLLEDARSSSLLRELAQVGFLSRKGSTGEFSSFSESGEARFDRVSIARDGERERSPVRGLVFSASVVILLAARFDAEDQRLIRWSMPLAVAFLSLFLPNRRRIDERRSQPRLTEPRYVVSARAREIRADARVAVFRFFPAKVLASVR